MRGGIGVLLCATLAIGCPSIEKDPLVTESANTIAIFAPDSANRCNSVLPFPSDLSKDRTTGLLNLPHCPGDSAEMTAFVTGLSTLNGYSINSPITAPFSGPIDTSTIDGSVVILEVVDDTTLLPHDVAQALFVASGDPDDPENPPEYLLTVFADTFKEETKYIVLVSNAIKDADGGEIISDQIFTLMKSDTPLVDAEGFSVIGLDDASANSLEQLRQAWQPIFAASTGVGIAKEDLLAGWSFTTQTVTASYAGLAALVAGGATAPTLDNTLAASAHPLLSANGIPTSNICKMHTGRVTLKNLLTDAGMFGVDATGAPIISDEAVEYVLFTPNIDQTQPPNPLAPNPTLDCSPGQPDVDFANAAHFQGVVVFAHTLSRCKNIGVALANTLGSAGWAVLALDGPRGGARSINGYGDQDLDMCPDQPGTPELIGLAATPNPFGVRDRMRQWGLEIAQVAELLKLDVRGFTNSPGAALPVEVGVVGHSWGGMAAVLAGSVSTNIDVMSISAASGGMGAIFTPLLRAGLAAKMGLEIGDPVLERETQTIAQIYTWALEPADPLYAAAAMPASLPVLAQVLAVPGDNLGADLHHTSTQEALGAALAARGTPSQSVTATLECATAGGGTDPVCYDDMGDDDALGVVGASLQPCDGDAVAARTWTGALHAQMGSYIGSGGLVAVPFTAIFGGPLPACTP